MPLTSLMYFTVQLKEEISRCEELKKSMIDRLIGRVRSELLELWDKCYVTAEQRQAFLPFSEGGLFSVIVIY